MFHLINKSFHTIIYAGEKLWKPISKYALINSSELLTLLQMLPSAFKENDITELCKLKCKYLGGSDIMNFIDTCESLSIKQVSTFIYEILEHLSESDINIKTVRELKATDQPIHSYRSLSITGSRKPKVTSASKENTLY